MIKNFFNRFFTSATSKVEVTNSYLAIEEEYETWIGI